MTFDSIFGFTLAIATIVGAVVTLVTYLQSRRRVRPCYCKWGECLVEMEGVAIPGLVLSYDDIPVQRLFATRFVFWNGGSEALSKEDVVEKVEVVSLDSGLILERQVVARSQEASAFTVEAEDEKRGRLTCRFELLNPGHFAIIDLLHTGQTRNLSVRGVIRGSRDGFKELFPDRRTAWIMLIGGFFAGALTFLTALDTSLGLGWQLFLFALLIPIVIAGNNWLSNWVSSLPIQVNEFAHPPAGSSYTRIEAAK